LRGTTNETRQYVSQLLAEVTEHAEREGEEAFLVNAFTDLVLGGLEEEGFWPDFQLSFYQARGVALNAWGIDHATRTLYLCATDFHNSSDLATISKSDSERAFKRLTNFFERSLTGVT
jgi:hypothetical protein